MFCLQGNLLQVSKEGRILVRFVAPYRGKRVTLSCTHQTDALLESRVGDDGAHDGAHHGAHDGAHDGVHTEAQTMVQHCST